MTNEKNRKFIQEKISENLIDVLEMMIQMNVSIDKTNTSSIRSTGITKKNLKRNALRLRPEQGKIKIEDKEKLEICEEILRKFFVESYSEIKDVRYETKEEDGKIKYSLYFYKKIKGNIIKINYKQESKGTQTILQKLIPIIRAALGEFVVIDEIDGGTHDLFIKTVIDSLQDKITGQLIFTTHNTLLLETLNKSNIYVIVTDYEGNKEINCIDDYDFEVQKNHNLRDLYLKGMFGGIPFVTRIDFDDIVNELEGTIDKHEEKKKA